MITGYFISVNIPEVPVGEDILATIDFYAINPGALLWQSFLVVDSSGLDLLRLLDAANETGAQGGREKTYNLGPMPDKRVGISFFIFGHPTPAPFYSWDWDVYNAWMEGFPLSGGLVYLDSEYKFISPGEPPPPPEEGTFSGVITEVKPLTFEFGELVKLLVSFTAYARDWPAQILWETRVTATLDGLSGSDRQNHTGEDGSRDEQPLHLGAMPNRNLTGEVILEARVSFPWSWVELYRIPIRVTVGVEPPPPPPEECVVGAQKCERGDLYECVSGPDYNYWELIEEDSPECVGKEFPWLPVALIGGGVLVAGVALARKPKK